MNNFTCENVQLTNPALNCSDNSPAAINSIFATIAAIGFLGLILFFVLSSSFSKIPVLFIATVFVWVGLVVAGYNMPRTFVFYALNISIIYVDLNLYRKRKGSWV